MTLPEILIASVVVIAAVVMILGARRRWRWLVDPPTFLWPIYPYALVKVLFGRNAVIWLLYISGITMLLGLAYAMVLLR
jgi:hypothetical protein